MNEKKKSMRKTISCFIGLLMSLAFCTSCVTEDTYNDSPEGNFEALWHIIDRQYCFLDYKHQEYGLDWNQIYSEYKNRISPKMNNEQVFQVLSEMLNELRDGHVNLSSTLEYSQYRQWFDNYPANFSDSLQRVYLGKDYALSSSMKYQIFEDNIGYIYIGSFASGLGAANLDEVLYKLSICDGLIIDVRNNGGGNLTTADKLAERFTNEKVLTGYISHKTGPEHNDFSTPEPVYLEPAMDRVRWQKPAVVLTNRRSYSATNSFVSKMRQLPSVTIIGDKTGGGSGLPFSSELPNGWSVRFSASPMFDLDMQHTEFGIDPDIKVDITSEDMQRNRDTIIEAAREYIRNQKNK